MPTTATAHLIHSLARFRPRLFARYFAAEEELPHHRWMAKAVEESAYELQEIEEYEELAHQDMKAHKL